MKYVKVKFVSDRDAAREEYHYKCRDSLNIKKYDSVAVETRYGITLAIITGVSDTPDYNATKCVLEKVTIKALDATLRDMKLKDLEKKMTKATKNLDSLAKFKMYAELSPGMAEMVKEYQQLIGVDREVN